MTTMQCSTSYGPVVPPPGEAAETDRLLRLATALRHSARRSEDNVIALGERIAGRRAARKQPIAPLQRWLEAHGQAGLRAAARAVEAGPVLAGLVLWSELTGCWLDANLAFADALFCRPRA
jgi:hypothetical protein